MNQAARPPLRLPPAIPIAVIALCVGYLVYAFFPIFKLAGQWFAVIAVILAFRYWPPMFRWVKSMPAPHRAFFALILAAMVLGHLTVRDRTWYPFIPWAIFPTIREEDPVKCPEFIATTASGQKVRLIVEQLFPSIVQINPLGDPAYFAPAAYDHLASVLAKAYDQQGPTVARLSLLDIFFLTRVSASPIRQR